MKNLKGIRIATLLGLICSMLVSCNNSSDGENPNDQLSTEIAAIDQYLSQQGITAFAHFSGVRIHILKFGTGFPANVKSTVDVNYTGKLFDGGSVFDAGTARGVLNTYIPGWQFSFTSLPAGTEAVLYIPSLYGYGKEGQGTIPANATLVFQVKFNEVVKTSQELQKLASDTVAIDTYLADKGINAVKDTTGLRYVITEPGSGVTPGWYDKVKFKSSYRLLSNDGAIVASFDQEPDETTNNLVIDQLTDGLKLGLQKMRAGGKATLYIPSGLGFGAYGAGNGSEIIIPANSNIIIDVEFTSIITP
jgi:FKBP-type peptidyl-prolyl cis-trans isomerase